MTFYVKIIQKLAFGDIDPLEFRILDLLPSRGFFMFNFYRGRPHLALKLPRMWQSPGFAVLFTNE
jgi:hypothetical protein